MTEVAVRAADLVLVTSIPDFLSTYGLNAFVETIWRRSGRQGSHIRPKSEPYVLVTRYQAQVRQHQQTLAAARRRGGGGGCRLPPAGYPHTPGCGTLADALVPVGGTPPTFSAKYGAHVPNVLIPLVAEVKDILHGA